jgi:polygalacturonase
MRPNSQVINIIDYGAIPNSGELCTKAVQAALDDANAHGNCTVMVPSGEFIIGSINLGKASLYLDRGAVLKGSPSLADYVPCGYHHNEMGDVLALLYSMHSDGLRLSGEGTIDLNGDAFYNFDEPIVPKTDVEMTPAQKLECTVTHKGRPNQPIFLYQCKNVVVEGLQIKNAPCWTFSFIECENVRMLDLTIDNNLRIPNNDGMHFCASKKILIRGCVMSCGDDCIALSSITDWDIPCEDVVISDCILTSCSKTIVIGYMHSIVRNVCISNVIIKNSNRGICIMSSAGTGLVENVSISNVQIDTRVRAGNWWGNGEAILMMGTYHHIERYSLPPPIRTQEVNIRNIHISSAICHTENAIGLVGVNKNIQGVRLSGLTVQMKDSDNLMVKGKMFDLAPSRQIDTLPNDGNTFWLHMQDVQDVDVHDVFIAPFHGSIPKVSQRDCQACNVVLR